jgi:hypothetical protein
MKKKKTEIKPVKSYKDTITFECPVRGIVSQEVEVKVYKSKDTYYPLFLSEEVEALLDQEASLSDDDF